MKKILQIIATGGLVLLLSACGCQKKTSQETGPQTAAPSETPASQPESGIISSIKDAFSSGKKMQCTFTEKQPGTQGDVKYTLYTDGKKNFKTQFAITAEGKITTMNSLMNQDNGGTMYSWNEGEKTGMKFTVACMKEVADNMPQGQNTPPPPTDTEDPYQGATDVKCEPASSVDITVPSDIVFTDQCEMMKNLTKNLPDLEKLKDVKVPDNLPKNLPTNIPNIPNIPQ
jgi:hypothetical protein